LAIYDVGIVTTIGHLQLKLFEKSQLHDIYVTVSSGSSCDCCSVFQCTTQ